ncbi:MAG: nucleotidyl transferase AbiEii/AbiGii toxin family protein, partial [Lachnospiraceae bacterium]|nr:nucleotidyl transferase AbiEii/AbiGii toxin family protein [Lachnospiraceae bacterium]
MPTDRFIINIYSEKITERRRIFGLPYIKLGIFKKSVLVPKCRYRHFGTSLSKAYGLIERFSEDIDLILEWRVIGYKKDETWEERSNTKHITFIADSRVRLFDFLRNDF